MYVIVGKFESVYYKKCVKAQTRIRLSGQAKTCSSGYFITIF